MRRPRPASQLQVLGIGTAMKILFADNPERDLSLQRNDVIALINVFDRLARSVETVHSMREQEFQLRMARYNEAAAVRGGGLTRARWGGGACVLAAHPPLHALPGSSGSQPPEPQWVCSCCSVAEGR